MQASQSQQATLEPFCLCPQMVTMSFSLFWVQFLIRLIHKELSCPGPAAGIQAP